MGEIRCCMCGRRLTDPDSQAIGMGPECRAKAGWQVDLPARRDRSGDPTDNDAGPFTIGIPEIDVRVEVLVQRKDWQGIAEILLKVAALHQHDPRAVLAAWQIRRLGYETTARAVLYHVARIEIWIDGATSQIKVRVPNDVLFGIARKAIPSASIREEIEDSKVWTFRQDTPAVRTGIVRALRRSFPGEAILTPSRVILPDGSAVLEDGSIVDQE